MMPKNRLGRVLLLAAASLLALVAIGWQVCWRSPPCYQVDETRALPAPVMTSDEYARVADAHAEPYVVDVAIGNGAVLLYGASHTKDPNDPQIADIRRRFTAFEPTVALCEGRLGFLIEAFMDPVATYGEGGAVVSLARESGVPTYTWELEREREVAIALEKFPAAQVALSYVLRPYFGNLRHGKPSDPAAAVEPVRARRTRYPGLEGQLPSVAAIDAVWRRDFADVADWRDTSDASGLPGYLGDIASHLGQARDEHFARVLLDLAAEDERIFAIAGSSHSVKLERVLRAAAEER